VRDTSAEAARVQAEIYGRMSGARKVLIACRMSDAVRSMARARDVAGILRTQGASLDLEYLESWIEPLGLRTEWNLANTAK
jgi:hypothetical protein